ncbi:MAG: NAD(P)/FAD-dependent oxidoreductase [Chloroflexi bacterium]|nr:NAD(P)/FAD-dependent oxidoreductase [Chloroflexota bacterium]MBI5964520.1 NAD(P)/FAD-dependent oxidoreductase [Chloroflexota bacterium]
MSDEYDVIVIGAGPVGLFAAFYAGMRNLRTLVLEALPKPGGQITALYPEKYIYDVGGFPAILGRDLVTELYKQSNQFGADFRFNERVESLEMLEPGHLRLATTEGVYFSKTAIIAAGIGAFQPNRLNVTGAAEFEGKGVSYVVRERERFLGRRLLVVGGGDTAVDWSLELRNWASEVTLIHRSDYFEAHQRSVIALYDSQVNVHTQNELARISGSGRVEQAVIRDNVTGEERTLDVDDILVCIGFRADLGPINQWGLDLEGRKVAVNRWGEASMPGVYAVGDIAHPQDGVSMNLIAYGFGQATLAVGHASHFIHPKERVMHGHSSQRKGMKYSPVPGSAQAES